MVLETSRINPINRIATTNEWQVQLVLEEVPDKIVALPVELQYDNMFYSKQRKGIWEEWVSPACSIKIYSHPKQAVQVTYS